MTDRVPEPNISFVDNPLGKCRDGDGVAMVPTNKIIEINNLITAQNQLRLKSLRQPDTWCPSHLVPEQAPTFRLAAAVGGFVCVCQTSETLISKPSTPRRVASCCRGSSCIYVMKTNLIAFFGPPQHYTGIYRHPPVWQHDRDQREHVEGKPRHD